MLLLTLSLAMAKSIVTSRLNCLRYFLFPESANVSHKLRELVAGTAQLFSSPVPRLSLHCCLQGTQDTELYQILRGHRAIIGAQQVWFRFQICCSFSKLNFVFVPDDPKSGSSAYFCSYLLNALTRSNDFGHTSATIYMKYCTE